jgi:hypothetical protein
MKLIPVILAGLILAACSASGNTVDNGGSANGGGKNNTVASPAPVQGMLIPYTLTLRRFEEREALTIVGVMSEEFPGYHSHNLMKKASGLRRYEYRTTAKTYKMDEWLDRLLTDMGFDTDREIAVNIAETKIIIDKLVPTPARPISEDEKQRFN